MSACMQQQQQPPTTGTRTARNPRAENANTGLRSITHGGGAANSSHPNPNNNNHARSRKKPATQASHFAKRIILLPHTRAHSPKHNQSPRTHSAAEFGGSDEPSASARESARAPGIIVNQTITPAANHRRRRCRRHPCARKTLRLASRRCWRHHAQSAHRRADGGGL